MQFILFWYFWQDISVVIFCIWTIISEPYTIKCIKRNVILLFLCKRSRNTFKTILYQFHQLERNRFSQRRHVMWWDSELPRTAEFHTLNSDIFKSAGVLANSWDWFSKKNKILWFLPNRYAKGVVHKRHRVSRIPQIVLTYLLLGLRWLDYFKMDYIRHCFKKPGPRSYGFDQACLKISIFTKRNNFAYHSTLFFCNKIIKTRQNLSFYVIFCVDCTCQYIKLKNNNINNIFD